MTTQGYMLTEESAPNTLGPKPASLLMVVVKVNNSDPAAGYPSDVNVAPAFSYDVDVQTPQGIVRMEKDNGQDVVPNVPRATIPWLVKAFPVDAILPGVMIDGAVYVTLAEDRYAAPCTPTGGLF